jgi:adenylate cyclase
MADTRQSPDGRTDGPPAYLVVADADGLERSVPILDQLFIGRECAGISESRRFVIDDPEISRTHLEIRLDIAADQAFLIDLSSNGTKVNGVRLQRAVLLPIKPGDQIRVGDVLLIFRSQRFTTVKRVGLKSTLGRIDRTAVVMVVGDIVNYSTISQATDDGIMARSLQTLWHQLGAVLQAHQGTLSYFAGDALVAVWQVRRFSNAAALAIEFALSANRLVEERGSELPLRGPDGAPIRMGWGVVHGMAALAAIFRSADAVIGDATNVAFRLSGLAGRQGRAAVLATSIVRGAAASEFVWGESEFVEIEGRSGRETIFPVLARKAATTTPSP